MIKKMKVGVLYGGVSSEREVSINTGKQISRKLNKEKYEVHEILVNEKKDVFKCEGMDFVFIALHGTFGEDGKVQSILEALDIKYNGCDFFTSSICMNKHIVKDILCNYNVKMARGITLNKREYSLDNFNLNFPVIIKPNSGGSSLGVFLCKTYDELLEKIKISFEYDNSLLIEEFIEGEEITCGILNGQALPILKILPKNKEFFNYEAKYNGETIEDLANLEKELDEKVKNITKKCYDVLGCKVYSRVDYIIKNNEPYFLEINTLPGMTMESLFPKMAKMAKMEFEDLLDVIINSSFEKKW